MESKAVIENIVLNGSPEEKRELYGFDSSTNKRTVLLKFKLFTRGLYPRYFTAPSAPFHDDMVLDMIASYYGERCLIAGFRGCAKTALKKLFDAFVLLNDRDHYRKYIKILSKDGKNSQQIVTDVYNLLVEAAPIYGKVFEAEGDFKHEERMSSFTLASGVKYSAGTVGQTQRGHIQDAYRPDWCHEKGTIIYDNGQRMKVEEHPSFERYRREEGVEVRLRGLPYPEVVTKEHKYWVKTIAKKRLKSVDMGDGWEHAENLVNVYNKRHYIGLPIDREVIPVPKLKKNKAVIQKRGPKGCIKATSSKLVDARCELLEDEEWWWLLGYFWGKGNLGSKRDKASQSRVVALTINNKDKETYNRVVKLLNAYNMKYQLHDYIGCFRLQFSNAVLARFLRGWYTGGAGQKRPPLWVEKIDIRFQNSLVRGYIAADGWVDRKTRGVRITSVSLDGLYSLRRMLARLGLPSTIRHGDEAHSEYEICGKRCKTQKKYDIRISGDLKALGIECRPQTRYKYTNTFIRDGFLWTQVTKVTPTEGRRLFCPIHTTTEMYNTEFGRSHNCWFEDCEDRESIRSLAITRGIIDKCGEAIDGLSVDGSYFVSCNYISDQGTIQWFMDKPQMKVRIVPILSDPKDDTSATWSRFTPEKIASLRADSDDWWSEYMCDPMRSENRFFDVERIEEMMTQCKPPLRESAGVRYWSDYKPNHRYGQGSDHSEGVGLDSNALAGFDFTEGEQVYSYHSNIIAPDLSAHEFARVGAEFGNCLYAPENNNKCGGIVITTLKNLPYPNIYRPRPTDKVKEKLSDKLGWETNGKTKYTMFFEFRDDFNNGLIKINDVEILKEMKAYTNADLTESKAGLATRHFDLLTATVIAWQMRKYAVAAQQKAMKSYAGAYDRYLEEMAYM